jgi:hypothetical protein
LSLFTPMCRTDPVDGLEIAVERCAVVGERSERSGRGAEVSLVDCCLTCSDCAVVVEAATRRGRNAGGEWRIGKEVWRRGMEGKEQVRAEATKTRAGRAGSGHEDVAIVVVTAEAGRRAAARYGGATDWDAATWARSRTEPTGPN